jgi:Holliday junction resolvase RusA-like endonuclease
VKLAVIAFDVRGLPVAQGTARAFVARGRAILTTEANRTSSPLGAWRSAIATEARASVTGPPVTGPVEVALAFRFPRPRAHFRPATGHRPTPELRLDAPLYHAGRPDADKLTRAALDALTSVVFADDGQVARLIVAKRYVDETEGPGVAVRVQHLETTR